MEKQVTTPPEPTWSKRINGVNTIIFFLLVAIIYFLGKTLYSVFECDCSWGHSLSLAFKDIGYHMDFFGYLIGAGALVFGAFITKKVEANTREKFTQIAEANAKIVNSTTDIQEATRQLVDASRRIVDDMPDIFNHLIEMLSIAFKQKASKFYFMNGPSTFGKIHSYNKRVLRCFKEDGSSETEILDHEIRLVNQKITEVENLIFQCAENVEDFKMLVGSEMELFAKDYLDIENSDKDIDEGNGIMYYTLTGLKIENKEEIDKSTKENKSVIEEKVKKDFKEFNQKVIDICRRQRESKGKAGDVVLTKTHTDMQLYLVDIDAKTKLSFMIFYFDDQYNSTQQRRLVGIYSNNIHVYKALESIYIKEYDSVKAAIANLPNKQ